MAERYHGRVAIVTRGTTGIGREPVEQWRELIEINLHGAMLTCLTAWPHLVPTHGNIVVISSLSVWMGVGAHEMERMGGFQPSAAYQASKAGIEGLAKHLAGRGGEHGLRVNVVRPGRILTEKWVLSSARMAFSGRTTRTFSYSSATAALRTSRLPWHSWLPTKQRSSPPQSSTSMAALSPNSDPLEEPC
jgi:NAD(P)-dependent dehydrogenase (short-subunit alcohol dehydrogenase family)